MINYLGKTYKSEIRKELTDEEFNQIREDYYRKPDFNDVKNQFIKIENGGTKTNFITNYYVKDLMAKVKIHYNNWTIEEALNYKPLMEFFAGKCAKNKKVFPDDKPLSHNIETAFRLCGFKTCSKPSNFPFASADNILRQYNANGIYYDFSCGWGIRLLSSLRNHISYIGTDPNYELTERLIQMGDDYKEATGNNTLFKILTQGSELFISKLEGKVGLAFSSPPYFNLEDYKIGDQSWHDGVSYDDWKNGYLTSTIENIYRYLIADGYFAININNFNKYNNYNLVGDTIQIAKSIGFKIYDVHELTNITRCSGHKQWDAGEICWHDNNEKIVVFRKN